MSSINGVAPPPHLFDETPGWTSTSKKRARTYRDTAEALATSSSSSRSSVDVAPPPADASVPAPPPAKQMRKTTPPQKSRSNDGKISINWEERKSLCESYPNDGYIESIMKETLDIFYEISRDFAKTPSETGPSMLWHLLPAVAEAIQSTPWCHFHSVREEYRFESLIVFVNYTYGDRGQEMTINQKKFRMVLMGKVKGALLRYLRTYFACGDDQIQIVYANKFFTGE